MTALEREELQLHLRVISALLARLRVQMHPEVRLGPIQTIARIQDRLVSAGLLIDQQELPLESLHV